MNLNAAAAYRKKLQERVLNVLTTASELAEVGLHESGYMGRIDIESDRFNSCRTQVRGEITVAEKHMRKRFTKDRFDKTMAKTVEQMFGKSSASTGGLELMLELFTQHRGRLRELLHAASLLNDVARESVQHFGGGCENETEREEEQALFDTFSDPVTDDETADSRPINKTVKIGETDLAVARKFVEMFVPEAVAYAILRGGYTDMLKQLRVAGVAEEFEAGARFDLVKTATLDIFPGWQRDLARLVASMYYPEELEVRMHEMGETDVALGLLAGSVAPESMTGGLLRDYYTAATGETLSEELPRVFLDRVTYGLNFDDSRLSLLSLPNLVGSVLDMLRHGHVAVQSTEGAAALVAASRTVRRHRELRDYGLSDDKIKQALAKSLGISPDNVQGVACGSAEDLPGALAEFTNMLGRMVAKAGGEQDMPESPADVTSEAAADQARQELENAVSG